MGITDTMRKPLWFVENMLAHPQTYALYNRTFGISRDRL